MILILGYPRSPQFNTTPNTAAKWVERFGAEGVDGLRDRSSPPRKLKHIRTNPDMPKTSGKVARYLDSLA
jgi:leucine-zipper of insertion element IS481